MDIVTIKTLDLLPAQQIAHAPVHTTLLLKSMCKDYLKTRDFENDGVS